jgi:hypothetical protein
MTAGPSYFLPSNSILLKSSCPFGAAEDPDVSAGAPWTCPLLVLLATTGLRVTDAAVKFAFFLAPMPALGGLGWNIPVGLVVSLTIRCAAALTAGLRFPRVEFRVMSVS